MKAVDVNSNTYIDSCGEINNEDPKFKSGDMVRKLKYKDIFARFHNWNWSE